ATRGTSAKELSTARSVGIIALAELGRCPQQEENEVQKPQSIPKPEGKLAVLLPGLGAVGTTFIAGCLLARRRMPGSAEAKNLPIGSLTQMGTIRLGKRTDGRSPKIKDFVPLYALEDLVFGGWDLFPDDAYQSAKHAAVLSDAHLEQVKDELSLVQPM